MAEYIKIDFLEIVKRDLILNRKMNRKQRIKLLKRAAKAADNVIEEELKVMPPPWYSS